MDLPETILQLLSGECEQVDSLSVASKLGLDHQKVVGAIKSLEAIGNVITSEPKTSKQWTLTDEGQQVSEKGSHEALVFAAVPESGGIPQAELMKEVGAVGKLGLGKAMAAGWLATNKSGGVPLIERKVQTIEDKVRQDLNSLKSGNQDEVPEKVKSDYKKRKLVQEMTVKSYALGKGSGFTTKIVKAETDLTPEMIASGIWKTVNFKPYNFDALGIQPPAGHLHPLLKVRAEYRQIFLEMGFSEMPTNNYVESSFWNFDALFQPQQHPARDAHDTFFISEPAEAINFPQNYLERVKSVHSVGGFGSQGYGYDWKIEEAKKNLLRTHTTAVSARMLYKLAEDYKNNGNKFQAAKYFSIDRVFRNETLDATHLAEFHQIEGLVADEGLTLGDLLGVIHAFFKKLGIEKLRFKPAYNPYTEPSMEIFSYHEGLKKWVEIGNSGIFRPEMLLPMGLPENVNVIAWGLSLERPTMIKYGIDNIRDLVGHKVNIKMVQENPLCRLDKDSRNPLSAFINMNNKRWDDIEERLKNIKNRIEAFNTAALSSSGDLNSPVLKDIVVAANPSRPPYSLKYYVKALSSAFKVCCTVHVHSSVTANLQGSLLDFLPDANTERSNCQFSVTLIWKSTINHPILSTTPGTTPIQGEANVGKYFSRILGAKLPLWLDESHPSRLAKLEEALDLIHSLYTVSENEFKKGLKLMLSKGQTFVAGEILTIADLQLMSLCRQRHEKDEPPYENHKRKCINADKDFEIILQ